MQPSRYRTPRRQGACRLHHAQSRLRSCLHTWLEVMEGEMRFRRRHDGREVAVRARYVAIVAPNAPLHTPSSRPMKLMSRIEPHNDPAMKTSDLSPSRIVKV